MEVSVVDLLTPFSPALTPSSTIINTASAAMELSPSNSDGGHGSFFEFGVFNGHVLNGLANLMNHLYIPTVKKTFSSNSETEGKREGLSHELNANMQKFEQQIRQVAQQLQGDVRLDIPAVTITDPEYVAHEDYNVRTQLEKALVDWSSVLAAAVESEHQKVSERLKLHPGMFSTSLLPFDAILIHVILNSPLSRLVIGISKD